MASILTSTTAEEALDRIRNRTATVAVMGLGYVGMPLAVAFAEAGFRTWGIDINEGRVLGINEGVSPVGDIPHDRVARLVRRSPDGIPAGRGEERRAGSIRASTNHDALYEADAVIICVPTPLNRTKEPDLSYIVAATDEVTRRLRPGALVVLESTSYPGTTEEVILPRLETPVHDPSGAHEGSGDPHVKRSVGEDFFLAFSPERIDPGRKDWTVQTTPKIVGGATDRCLKVAVALYKTIIDHVVPVSKTQTAEMVKLLENTFRATNIALANEMAMICRRLGVDVWEVIDAAKTKPFGYMPFYPGPGIGGHCIPVDPLYLAWRLRALNFPARSIQLAMEINCAMPRFVVDRIADELNTEGKALNGSTVLILGVTYKPDVGDLRESPALELLELLANKGVKVEFHDPYVTALEVAGSLTPCVEVNRETLARSDCVVIVTDHSIYNWELIVRDSSLIFDTRNALSAVDGNSTRVVKL